MSTNKSKNKEIIRLNLGCGLETKKGFINVDSYYNEEDLKSRKGRFKNSKWYKGCKYIKADILELPFPDNYADYVELANVIEHLPFRQVLPALIEIRRVMKKGATLLVATNDWDDICLDWVGMALSKQFDINIYRNLTEVMYGNQLNEGEFHKTPFNAAFLDTNLSTAGFKKGRIVLIKRNSPIPKIGSLTIIKNAVARNSLLIAEAVK